VVYFFGHSVNDDCDDDNDGDNDIEVMSETLVRALRVPTAKYPSSVTSSHEYGWYSQPLVCLLADIFSPVKAFRYLMFCATDH